MRVMSVFRIHHAFKEVALIVSNILPSMQQHETRESQTLKRVKAFISILLGMKTLNLPNIGT